VWVQCMASRLQPRLGKGRQGGGEVFLRVQITLVQFTRQARLELDVYIIQNCLALMPNLS
jgi:hypothetical protein